MYRLPVLLVLLLQSVLAADMPPVGRIVVFGDLHLESKVRALFPAVPFALKDDDAEGCNNGSGRPRYGSRVT